MKNGIKYCLGVLCISAFLFNLELYAQKTKTNPNGYNTFYFENGSKSSEGELKNGQPVGIWKNYYESGALKSFGERQGKNLVGLWSFYSQDSLLIEEINYSEGLRDGVTKKYTKEGFLEEEIEFKAGKKEGMSKEFDVDGRVISETTFTQGREHGWAYEFNAAGKIITLKKYKNGIQERYEVVNRRDSQGRKKGLWKTFYEDRSVETEGRYNRDLQDGYWKSYSKKGVLLETLKYDNGELVTDAEEIADLDVSELYYPDDDGGLRFRGTYRDGKAHGTHLWFSKSGDIDSAKVFRNGFLIGQGRLTADGLKDGPWEEYYYPNGELKAEGSYALGFRTGEWIYYFVSGKIEQRGIYNNKGRPNGLWKWYYETGELLREETFRGGKENGWLIEYSDTGSVITKGEFVDGLEEGVWFIEIGDHYEEGEYQSGLKMGPWKHTYLSNNKIRFEGEYFDDLEEGVHTWYYDTGAKMLQGKYVSGVKEGIWNRYKKDGTIYISIEYRGGREVRVDGLKLKFEENSKTEENP